MSGPTSVAGSVPGPTRSFFVFFDAERGKFFGDGLLDKNAFDREADLAAVGEAAPNRAAGGDFETGIGEDDHRVFAAEFEDGGDEESRAGFGDAAAGFDTASEADFVGSGVDQSAADFRATLNHRDDIFRESGVSEKLFDQRAALRREVTRLAHDCVSRDHRGNDLA